MINKKLKVGNVPNLRFLEFTEEWETKKLGEIGEIITGSTPPTNEESYYVGEYLFVSPADIQANRHVESTRTTLTEKGFKKGRKIRKGSSLFVCIGSTIGKIGQAKEDCITNQQINSVVSFNMEDDFVFSLLEFHSARIKLLSAEQAVPIINKTTFSNVEVNTPCIKEQQKIGSFLSFLDSRIQTQNKIIKELAVSKTTFAKKIFLQEVRFKDDNGNDYPEWEEKKLKQVATIQMGQSPESSSYNIENIGMPLVQGNADILNRKSHPRQYTSKPTKFSEIGDIILTVRAPVGYVAKSNQKTCIGRGVCSIKNNEKSTINFLYQFLLYFEDKWKALEQGSTFTAVSSSDINSISLNVPCLEEQAKISSFLSSLDSKIDVESKLLLKLEEQKKFLLQQLFV